MSRSNQLRSVIQLYFLEFSQLKNNRILRNRERKRNDFRRCLKQPSGNSYRDRHISALSFNAAFASHELPHGLPMLLCSLPLLFFDLDLASRSSLFLIRPLRIFLSCFVFVDPCCDLPYFSHDAEEADLASHHVCRALVLDCDFLTIPFSGGVARPAGAFSQVRRAGLFSILDLFDLSLLPDSANFSDTNDVCSVVCRDKVLDASSSSLTHAPQQRLVD